MNHSENLDFEISFYESLLKESPDFIDALIALGDVYTKAGCYKKGLEIDLRLSRLRPDDPIVHYNLACSYSLLKMADECIEVLEKAIGLGYREFAYMNSDQDLKFIRKDPRYKELISRYAEETSSSSDANSTN
ncbi:MAG: hypothetical protein JW869_03510 [Candidatus Omnitrophica bacterium]|nr:hypothetical protein [Candidatus Omnitrophota bacterium]